MTPSSAMFIIAAFAALNAAYAGICCEGANAVYAALLAIGCGVAGALVEEV